MRRSAAPTSTTTTSSTSLYSLALEPLNSPRSPTRPSPKSAGSASLPAAPPTLSRAKSWESDDKRGRSGQRKLVTGLTKLEVQEGSPFEDPRRSPSISTTGHRNSIISSVTNETPSLPPTPDCNYARRNSAISTSSMSQSPTSPMGMYVASTSRQRYSIASSSYAHTIGDLSTSSMPLLRHPTKGDETSSTNGTDANSVAGARYQASSSSRIHLAESSRASYYSDDASSIHSYPPKPRQRTGSSWTTSENGEASRNSWMREFESTGATGQVQRRGSADSRSDSWPPVVSNSFIHQPIARPVPAYLSQLSTYSFPPTSNLPSKVPPPRPVSSGPITRAGAFGSSNPLAPLRKRLARSLAGLGGHLHTEVQLLLELVDALDHCITLFSPSAAIANPDQAFSPASRTPPSSSTIPLPLDESPPSIGPVRSIQSKAALLDEVRLLVRELVELVPDAQRCLTTGQYGPLAFPNTTTSRLMQSLEKKVTESTEDPPLVTPSSPSSSLSSPAAHAPRPTSWNSGNSNDWWPSRLARDCRNLLVEAGLPSGRASTVWLAARLSEEDSSEVYGSPPPAVVVTKSGSTGSNTEKSELQKVEGDQEQQEADEEVELREALTKLEPPTSKTLKLDSETARRDELLEQGKKRWEAYRKKQMQRG
ncbi:hypothetical protein JCM5350_005834 [Sporobolomyces pararoseus]